jgi:hypothetical protein
MIRNKQRAWDDSFTFKNDYKESKQPRFLTDASIDRGSSGITIIGSNILEKLEYVWWNSLELG